MSEQRRESRDVPRQGNEKNVSSRRSPSMSSTGPQGPSSQVEAHASAVPDASSFFAQLIPDWEIDPTTHLMIHPRQCRDCAGFAKHVGEYVKGGALSIFINKMKEHWKDVLYDERREREEEAYQAGLDKQYREVKCLKEDLDDRDLEIAKLERENEELKRRLEELLADNTRASRGGTRTGKRSNRSRSRSPRRSSPPPRPRSPLPTSTSREKDKRKAEPTRSPPTKKRIRMFISDSEDTVNILDKCATNSPMNSEDEQAVCDTIQASALLRVRESHRVEGEAVASSSSDQVSSPFLARGRQFKPGTRRPGSGQRPPVDLESSIGDPASFTLDRSIDGAFLSVPGHVCLSQDSRWKEDASFIWSSSASQPWFWLNGKPYQMAKEAYMVPYDQRSLAQRYAVREATRAGLLPLADASVEPDVNRMASLNELPTYIRRDNDGRLNIQDITAWLFLTMTQPEPREGTAAWFWGTACLMFVKLGLFEEMTKEISKPERPYPGYIPKRFVHVGEFKASDVAEHFHRCGLTNRLASTVFRDFATNYVVIYPTAEEPNWASVPAPRDRESRPGPAKRRREGKKRAKNVQRKAVLKSITERLGGADPIARSFEDQVYDEPPPAGAPPIDVEMTNVAGQSGQDNMNVDPLPFSPMGPG